MSRDYSTYESPFCTRYASKEMQYIFSADKKFSTWRRLWVALARAEMNLGIDKITQEMVDELESTSPTSTMRSLRSARSWYATT